VRGCPLPRIIAFLNDKNREYAEGEADYNWSAWADNCSHTMRNALAAANIWSPLSVRAVKFRQIFNLAIPANEFVNLAELEHDPKSLNQKDILRHSRCWLGLGASIKWQDPIHRTCAIGWLRRWRAVAPVG